MFWKLLSLIAVSIGFLSLVVWVYLPRNKSRLEAFGHIPLSDEVDGGEAPIRLEQGQ